MLPEALQDRLPEGHLAHFISDAIGGPDLGVFHARYDKDGSRNQPSHPAMMVKGLVYACGHRAADTQGIDPGSTWRSTAT
jgi:hypothetical protein